GNDVEFGCTGADCSDGPLRVTKLDWMVIAGTEPVFQHERGDPHRVEPVRLLPTFVLSREVAVPATGRHDNCGSGASARCTIRGDRRPVRVGLTQCARRAVFPEQDLLW